MIYDTFDQIVEIGMHQIVFYIFRKDFVNISKDFGKQIKTQAYMKSDIDQFQI